LGDVSINICVNKIKSLHDTITGGDNKYFLPSRGVTAVVNVTVPAMVGFSGILLPWQQIDLDANFVSEKINEKIKMKLQEFRNHLHIVASIWVRDGRTSFIFLLYWGSLWMGLCSK
jgi:hypothetical protein